MRTAGRSVSWSPTGRRKTRQQRRGHQRRRDADRHQPPRPLLAGNVGALCDVMLTSGSPSNDLDAGAEGSTATWPACRWNCTTNAASAAVAGLLDGVYDVDGPAHQRRDLHAVGRPGWLYQSVVALTDIVTVGKVIAGGTAAVMVGRGRRRWPGRDLDLVDTGGVVHAAGETPPPPWRGHLAARSTTMPSN